MRFGASLKSVESMMESYIVNYYELGLGLFGSADRHTRAHVRKKTRYKKL